MERKSKRVRRKSIYTSKCIPYIPNYISILNRMTKHKQNIISNKCFMKLKVISERTCYCRSPK